MDINTDLLAVKGPWLIQTKLKFLSYFELDTDMSFYCLALGGGIAASFERVSKNT